MITIPEISQLLHPLDPAIQAFVQMLFHGHNLNETDLVLISLPSKLGGMGVIIPSKVSDIQYQNSVAITKQLSDHCKYTANGT